MTTLTIFILTTILVLAGCSSERITGNTSSETTNGVVAVIHHPDGTDAAGAVVRLRRIDYLTNVPSLNKTGGIIGANARTDESGRVAIYGIDTGSYTIEISDSNSRRTLLLPCTVADSTVNLGNDTLRPYATVTGSVDVAGPTRIGEYVQVYGLERLVLVDPTGGFILDDLPAGVLRLRITAADTTTQSLTIDSVHTIPGSTTTLPMAGWQFSKRIYLNTTASGANIAEDIAGFPLLVRIDSSLLNFAQAQDSGQDLRITKPDGSLLPYEIEQWDRINNRGVIWVLMDTVHGNDSTQHINLHWGNSNAHNVSGGPAVFDTANGFSGVWHLSEESPGTTGNTLFLDATVNRFHGADYVAATEQTGIIGDGHRLNRLAGDYIDLGRNRNFLSGASQVTLEAWCNVDNNDSAGMVLTHSLDYPTYPALSYAYIMVHGSVIVGARVSPADSVEQTISTSQRLIPGTWNHLVAVVKYDADSGYVYVNGALWRAGTMSFSGTVTVGAVSTMSVAGSQEQPHEAFFGGMLDELRTQRVGRSAEWVRLSYESQRVDQRLITVR